MNLRVGKYNSYLSDVIGPMVILPAARILHPVAAAAIRHYSAAVKIVAGIRERSQDVGSAEQDDILAGNAAVAENVPRIDDTRGRLDLHGDMLPFPDRFRAKRLAFDIV